MHSFRIISSLQEELYLTARELVAKGVALYGELVTDQENNGIHLRMSLSPAASLRLVRKLRIRMTVSYLSSIMSSHAYTLSGFLTQCS